MPGYFKFIFIFLLISIIFPVSGAGQMSLELKIENLTLKTSDSGKINPTDKLRFSWRNAKPKPGFEKEKFKPKFDDVWLLAQITLGAPLKIARLGKKYFGKKERLTMRLSDFISNPDHENEFRNFLSENYPAGTHFYLKFENLSFRRTKHKKDYAATEFESFIGFVIKDK